MGEWSRVQGQTQVRILATAIYPYRGEIQFWSKFLRALENSKSRRNSNLVRALNPIERMSPSANGRSAHRLIGMGARAHRPVCASSLRNGNPEQEREREL